MVSLPTLETKVSLVGTGYKVLRHFDEIKEYTIIKSTPATVWYQGERRVMQERRDNDWFPTKREALTELRKRLEINLQRAEDRYSLAKQKLKNFNAKHAGEMG